jgi:hypothetical protein
VVVEPGVTKTQFDANLLEPDSRVDEYREVRAALAKRWQAIAAQGDQPAAVADVMLKAAIAPHPKLRYAVGRVASMRMLRRFAPALVVDAVVRKNLQLDAGH